MEEAECCLFYSLEVNPPRSSPTVPAHQPTDRAQVWLFPGWSRKLGAGYSQSHLNQYIERLMAPAMPTPVPWATWATSLSVHTRASLLCCDILSGEASAEHPLLPSTATPRPTSALAFLREALPCCLCRFDLVSVFPLSLRPLICRLHCPGLVRM